MTTPDLPLLASHFVRARWRWHFLRGKTLQAYQDRRARQIVAYAQKHSPFYRSHWEGYDTRNWQALPLVDKQLMMENFDAFTTCGVRRDTAMQVALQAEKSRDFHPLLDNNLTVGLSSGTSGHRGLFLVSAQEQAAWAGMMLARTLHRLPTKQLRVAFFLRSNSNLYEQMERSFLMFRYFDLMLPLSAMVAALNDLQPHIIVAPPSLLGFLAHERDQDRLRIRPERLISVAEVLEAQDQARLQVTFAVPVHQIYQCTEGFLATSCLKGSLHIQEDLVALQFEPVADSEDTMRVLPIITDLWRRTQPIIRYRLNDILQLDPARCTCGSSFRVIRSIEGRCDDICYFESLAGGVRPFFPDTLRRMILLASPAITDYQIIQKQRGQLHIYLTVLENASFAEVAQAVRASALETIAHYACQAATMQIEEGLPPLAAGVKRRRVQCIAQD